jgi:hypothetical protein
MLGAVERAEVGGVRTDLGAGVDAIELRSSNRSAEVVHFTLPDRAGDVPEGAESLAS